MRRAHPWRGDIQALGAAARGQMLSKYGGNRNNVAWDLIGFEPHGATQPPYGYYDAQYLEEKRNGD